MDLGTEAVAVVTGEVSFDTRYKSQLEAGKYLYLFLGASGCIWYSIHIQIQIAKAESISIASGFNCV